jgi:cytochrome P450
VTPAGASGLVYPDPDVCRFPYPGFAELRRDAPVHRVPGRDEYLVSRHADIVHVMRQPELFSNLVFVIEDGAVRAARLEDVRPDRVGPIFSSDPPAHTRKRRLGFEYFKPGRLPGYEPLLIAIADELIDAFADAGEVEFVSAFATPFPTRAVMGILGFPASDSAEALRWGSYDGHGNRYLPPERRENMEDGIRAMVAHVRAGVVDRYEQPRDDVLSAFVRDRVEADGRLDLPNVTAEVVNLINGGMHTTRDMLGNTLRFLLDDPERRARAAGDPRVLVRAIDESLRLESTLQWTGRLALADTEIAGTPIPAGSIVILLLASANRDCRAFARPDEFDLDRTDLKSHLAFGTHIHSCLGAPLARVEGRIAFERLFARLPGLRLADDNDFAPRASLNFRGLEALRLVFDTG